MSNGMSGMTPNRPYLLRAMHEWIVDNGLTPQIVVDAGHEQVRIPPSCAQDGKVVLNISASAVRGLRLGNEWVEFSARFGGAPYDVAAPVHTVLAIVARENGVGMSFPEQPSDGPAPGGSPSPEPRGRPNLRVVK